MAALPFKFFKHTAAPTEVRIAAGSRRMTGNLRNFTDGAIQVSVPELLRDACDVSVTLTDDCVLEGRVLYCNLEDGAYHAGIYFVGDEERRRRQPRFATRDEPVRISFLGSRHASMDASVIDVSASGVGLKLSARISLGEWVKVEMKSAILFGEVRHCRQEPDGTFRAGIEIETAVSRGNPRNSEDSAHSENWILFEQALH